MDTVALQPGAGSLTVVPANQASFEELQAVFGTRGQAARCQCQRYKLAPLESFGSTPVEERAQRLRVQTSCGDPGSPETSGLTAYLDGVPAGWCAVEPRCNYESLLRNQKVPWSGRDEDKQDCTVWAITCLFARAGFRRQGISRNLIGAAVSFARDRGARAIEAYPMTTTRGIDEELHSGLLTAFLDAGFTEVTRPTERRAVVRVELASQEDESAPA
jgi:GNAT superfamily N-acetyltransferase